MHSERLLIVDDDASTGRTLELILGKKGFDVEVAHTGFESLDRVREKPFNLAFVDVRLPDVLGSDLIARLQEMRSDMVVVMVTAHASVENAITALNNGASAYLTKPLNIDELLSVVRESLSKQRLARENRRLLEVAQRELLERKKAEVELERLRAVVESTTTDFVGVTRADGKLLYVNRHGREMVGLGPDERLGELNVEDIHPESAWQVLKTVGFPAAEEDGAWTGEVAFKGPGGGPDVLTSMTLLSHKSPDGRVELFSTISRNITEQRTLERQLQAAQRMEAVGRLAGGVAHDFNNCLQVVLGHAELLKSELNVAPSSPAHEALSAVIDAGDRAARLAEQLLAFSRRQVQHLAPVDLNQTVRGMEGMIRRLIGEDVVLRVRLGEALGLVSADKAQLEQILMNLVANARDAMNGGGALLVETERTSAPLDASLPEAADVCPGEYVVLRISDTGCGMDEETQLHAFEPFYTTKAEQRGTGLGLSTVYGIVKQSEGFIGIDSAVGRGSTFRIYLPHLAAPREPRTPSPLGGAARPGRETVLLVEDEAMVRRLASRILERHGFRVLSASSGAEALVTAERHAGPIHLLLTDVIMPQMSGPQLAERLRELRSEVHVLFMSGYTDRELNDPRATLVDSQFIGKPFKPQGLLKAVCRMLDAGDAEVEEP